MKTKSLIFALLLPFFAPAQSKLDSLDIAPAQWRTALVQVAIFGDTLRCKQTNAVMYRAGRYRDRIVYKVKGKTFDFSEAEILKWCARKEGKE